MKKFLLILIGFLFVGCTSNKAETIKGAAAVPEIELADPLASDNAKRVMAYFRDEVYGKHIVSGIMDCAWSNTIDMDAKVFADTGKHAALMGFDFIELSKKDSRTWYNPNQVKKAIQWWNDGGLVSFCWHWLDPSKESANGASFRPEETDFRIPYDEKNKCLDTTSPAFAYIKKDLDTIAVCLQELEFNDVVVLFRPLHEGAGNWGKYGGAGKAWFWWGASGPEPYIALYKYMFEYFTIEKNIHNLIWIWNGQHEAFYPGDEYVDIIGWDPYVNNHGALTSYYEKCLSMSDNPETNPKFVAITENDCVPYADQLIKAKANWLFFMIWNDNDNLLDDSKTDKDNFWGGPKFNTLDDKTIRCFDTEYVITRDELNIQF